VAPDLATALLEVLRLTLVMVVALFLPLLLELTLLLIAGNAFRGLSGSTFANLSYVMELVGVAVHEFSHAAATLITLGRVEAVKPLLDGETDAFVAFSHANVLTRFVAGIAPLLGGLGVLWLTGEYVIPDFTIPSVALPQFDIGQMTLGGVVVEILHFLGSYFDATLRGLLHLPWGEWRTYAGLYVALSVASCIAPSDIDLKIFRRALPAVLLLLVLVVGTVYGLGDSKTWFERVQAGLLPRLLGFSTAVGMAFALTFFGILLFLPFRLYLSVRRTA